MASRRINCHRRGGAHLLPGASARFVGLTLAFSALAVGFVRGQLTDRDRSLDSAPGKFFVANEGNDRWSGSFPSPNAGRSDGPFATLPRAVQAARDFGKNGGMATNSHRVIMVRDGGYILSKPLILTPADSGMVIAAPPNEWPVVSGGRLISKWKETTVNGRHLWVADVPEVREGKLFFRELWVNDQRAVRARHPHHGYLKVADLPDTAKTWTEGQKRFRFAEGDLKAWNTVINAEVVVMSKWVESRLPVVDVDEKNRIASFRKRAVFALEPGDLYYAEGAFEFLEEPGEWYLDRTAGRLYYLPRAGEKLDVDFRAHGMVFSRIRQRCQSRDLAGATPRRRRFWTGCRWSAGRRVGRRRAAVRFRALRFWTVGQLRPGTGARMPGEPDNPLQLYEPGRWRN
jgi:hypothetical protein